MIENRYSDSHVLLMGVNEFLLLEFSYCWTDWVKFGVENLHVISVSVYKFREHQFNERHALLRDVKKVLRYKIRRRKIFT